MFAILDFHIFFNFWLPIRLEGLLCIVTPNFIKIGQAAAEISHLTFFKIADSAILDFKT